MWHMNGVGWGWWVLMSVAMVAVWALVIYGVYSLARERESRPGERDRETPEDVLKRRLAAGEIGVDEYERLREAIADNPAAKEGEPALR